jgi:hypothetical protein
MALALVVACLVPAVARAHVTVTLAADGLDVRCEQATTDDVLHAIADAVGAEVTGVPQHGEDLTMHFIAPSPSAAVTRIVHGNSVALRYGRDGRLRTIERLAPSATVSVPAQASTDEEPGELLELGEGMRTIVGKRLARTLGTTQPTLRDLAVAAWSLPDLRLRAAALEALGSGIEEHPLVAALTVRALAALDPSTVAAQLDYVAGKRARHVLAKIGRNSQIPAVKDWARTVAAAGARVADHASP